MQSNLWEYGINQLDNTAYGKNKQNFTPNVNYYSITRLVLSFHVTSFLKPVFYMLNTVDVRSRWPCGLRHSRFISGIAGSNPAVRLLWFLCVVSVAASATS